MNNILELNGVHKSYRNVIAVNEISFSIANPCIFGLLGPNGAGKTSLIRIITGITQPDRGTIHFNGQELSSNLSSQIGYMPEERGLYKKMTVGEQLIYLCRLKGLSKADAEKSVLYWIKKFEIESWWNKKIEELSKGMSQKVQFIATIAHRPKLIILDEPFSGLDPINTNLIKEEIIKLKDNGVCIIFSTHRMEQVEEMCDQIVLINKGKNVLHGLVQDIRMNFRENLFEAGLDRNYNHELDNQYEIISGKNNPIMVKLKSDQNSNQFLTDLMAKNYIIQSYREVLPTFNDIFIKTVNAESHE